MLVLHVELAIAEKGIDKTNYDMLEKWNQFVYDLCEAKKKDVEEDSYHSLIETQLQLLGWAKYKSEICHKPNIPIGNNKFIQPDILIKNEVEDLFVIEVKRPVHTMTEREQIQLESYMRQLKLDVGIYIGEHIEVFYDKPKSKHAVPVLQIPLEINNKLGTKFVEQFSKESFGKETIIDFCEERIKEMERQANLNTIKENLIADAQKHITESLKPYLIEKYAEAIAEEEISKMLLTLRFTATEDTNAIDVHYPTHVEPKMPISAPQGKTKKRVYDHTTYSLDGGSFLGKNKFVYAVVSSYVKKHPQLTFKELEKIFRPEMQGSFGVIRTMEYIYKKNYEGRRYFKEEENQLLSGDGIKFAVSTEWGKDNLPNIVKLAKELGFMVISSSEGTESLTQNGIKCSLKRNADVKGIFNPQDNSLTVLKGSKINPSYVEKVSERIRKKRDQQMSEYTELIDGECVVKENVHFDSPSGAAEFCVGGSSNGWKQWKDEKGNKLLLYRHSH